MSWCDHYPITGRTFAGFEVLRKIGSGGMAEVFLILDPDLEVKRALKVVRPEFEGDDKVTHRFQREAKLHAQVQDRPTWVIPIHSFGRHHGIPYIIMPYLPAGSLMDLVTNYGPLSIKTVVKLVHELANGLTITEEAGLVHRDIKPSNILLQQNGYIGLSDFGMSTYEEKSAARTVAGTPGYMSPEQFIAGHSQDVRSDIFSLGCTLHYLLCGKSPFGNKVNDVLEAHQRLQSGEIPDLCRSDVPNELLAIRDRALQYDPNNRFQSSEEIAAQIRGDFSRDFLDDGLAEVEALVLQTLRDKQAKNDAALAETILVPKS